MPLLSADRVHSLLTCPRCGSPLVHGERGFGCSSASCPYSRDGFPMVGEQPVVIDFERSIVDRDSIVQSGGVSAVPRGKDPGRRWLRGLFSPFNHVAERHAKDLVDQLGAGPVRLLVVGGGTMGSGAAALYEAPGIEIIAFDIYASPFTQFVADAHAIPLPDASVDAVWVQAVLEHVLDPARAVSEIERVLKPRGWVYSETPFLQHVHEGPFDFTRFTESGHRWLFRRFERLDSGVVSGTGTQLAWTYDFLTRGLLRSESAGKIARMLSVWATVFDRIIPETWSVDAASCVFFYGRKSDCEITPREMIAHYRGAQQRGSG